MKNIKTKNCCRGAASPAAAVSRPRKGGNTKKKKKKKNVKAALADFFKKNPFLHIYRSSELLIRNVPSLAQNYAMAV